MKALLNLPTLQWPLRYLVRVEGAEWGGRGLGPTLRRWSGAATGQCENCGAHRGGTTNMSSNLLSAHRDK